jgi:hypothetical protein
MPKFSIRRNKIAVSSLVAMVSLCAICAAPLMANETGTSTGKVEQINEKWSKRVLQLTNSIDGFFGNDRIEEDSQKTRVKVRLDFDKEESNSLDTRIRISARLSLPNLENKWAVVINGDDDDSDDSDLEEEEDRSLALRFDAKSSLNRNLEFDLGLKRPDGSYEAFERARYRRTDPVGRWIWIGIACVVPVSIQNTLALVGK